MSNAITTVDNYSLWFM